MRNHIPAYVDLWDIWYHLILVDKSDLVYD